MITFLNGNLEPLESDPTKQRRRRWSRQQKAAIVAETYRPNMSVPLVADRYNIAPTQLLTWRRLFTQPTTSTAVGATTDDPVVPLSLYRALEQQVHELQRLLGKKVLENEHLRTVLHSPDPALPFLPAKIF